MYHVYVYRRREQSRWVATHIVYHYHKIRAKHVIEKKNHYHTLTDILLSDGYGFPSKSAHVNAIPSSRINIKLKVH